MCMFYSHKLYMHVKYKFTLIFLTVIPKPLILFHAARKLFLHRHHYANDSVLLPQFPKTKT
jgi:hypothetical protein